MLTVSWRRMNVEEAARLRREYDDAPFDIEDLADNPMAQFAVWFSEATAAGIDEANAFVLATVDGEGRPSARAVLMKEFSETSLVFYTNLESRKSIELKRNPYAAAAFVWSPIHRQVRIEGAVRPVDDDRADAYFATRPRGAQIAAHSSMQSQVISDREVLEERFREMDATFGETVPRPATWGGWEISAETVEFWQGRTNRFHDRFRYGKRGKEWQIERLQP
jgi:pyridoxamine 5'-phosphate oxidase